MNKNQYFSNSKAKGVIVLLLLTLLVGSILLYRRIGLRPKATPGVPSLSFWVSPGTLQAGQNFDLIFKVNPNNASFYAFELYANYDPTKVEFQNNTNLSQNISSSYLLA